MTTPHNILSGTAARILRSRHLMRAPIWIYRARLGFLFGSRLLMLEHIGRKSGTTRRVVLEVVGHPEPDTYVVVSGFGERAQWFRNLQANSRARVSVGARRSVPADAGRLPVDDADRALRSYARQHPRAWKRLAPTLEETLGAPITAHGSSLPVIGLRLHENTSAARETR